MTSKPRGGAKPSQRLKAEKPKANAAIEAPEAGDGAKTEMPAPAVVERDVAMVPTKMRVATKFVVTDKAEVPVVVGQELSTRFHVKLEAAYEARSILNGLATEQGNGDNRIFGAAKPDAVIGMVIESKAIADTFMTGHAFEVVFTEMV